MTSANTPRTVPPLRHTDRHPCLMGDCMECTAQQDSQSRAGGEFLASTCRENCPVRGLFTKRGTWENTPARWKAKVFLAVGDLDLCMGGKRPPTLWEPTTHCARTECQQRDKRGGILHLGARVCAH